MPSIIKSSHVRRAGSGAEACRASVRLLRHDGHVRAIELTCSCGEVTVVELEYPETHPPPESAP